MDRWANSFRALHSPKARITKTRGNVRDASNPFAFLEVLRRVQWAEIGAETSTLLQCSSSLQSWLMKKDVALSWIGDAGNGGGMISSDAL